MCVNWVSIINEFKVMLNIFIYVIFSFVVEIEVGK